MKYILFYGFFIAGHLNDGSTMLIIIMELIMMGEINDTNDNDDDDGGIELVNSN